MRRAVLGAVLLLAACTKSRPNASRAECERYRARLFELLPDTEREHWRASGMDKPSKLELDFCEERVTSSEVACVAKAPTLDAALECKPTAEIRPTSPSENRVRRGEKVAGACAISSMSLTVSTSAYITLS